MASEIFTTPAVELRQISVRRHGLTENWNVVWEVENRGAKSLKLTSVRLPHGQFKAAEQQFEGAVELAPGGSAEFNTLVFCHEPPGLVTENAFVIFNVNWLREEWRIFVRVRVVVNSKGEPESATQLVTTQKIGFSGVLN